ncbi:ParA family protein [Noviherbaspirillum sp. CPCC 100848]|uniref:ParA family protein n=1 Tax=Noviherbaspirillum album TaxID=3080276 RepID=A0ABU6J3R4_9BURK|nr:ParA family protein [Noviherbaspirillum sp. CPCC 100848]MEC4718170.1 ParA family protein [Noviherbaspirillum sp. CPCC 100848]
MTLDLDLPPLSDIKVDGDELIRLSNRSANMLERIRDSMLQPHPRKQPPIYPSNKLQLLCNIDKTKMQSLLRSGKVPQGSQEAPGRMRNFSLEEAMEWVRATRKSMPRPEGKKGSVITIGNFKGGVTKTTTSMVLAQGLTVRHNRKVLIVDLDPQGSTTTFFGINPHAEIEADQTVLPLIEGKEPDLKYAPMKTYWHNLDLIPSSTDLFNAEFILPAKVNMGEDAQFKFWQVLSKGLEPLREEYDYIILDTAPTLSYLTINALFAGDSIIVPVVPDTLSFASMVQFWKLFSDLVQGLKGFEGEGGDKAFDYIDILITRMPNKPAATICRDWIIKTYGDHVLPMEIPETALAMSTSAEFSTVYDRPNWEGSAESYRRICDPYDRLVDIVDQKGCQIWRR